MASIIIMPKQGLLMEEGTITKWLVKEGEKTTEGTPLFEMETDKLTITMDSTATGTVLKILHPEGDTVPITQPIAIVGEPGEDISALLGGAAPAAPAAAPEKAGDQPAKAGYGKEQRRRRAELRAKIKACEDEMEACGAREVELDNEINSPEVYNDPDLLRQKSDELSDLRFHQEELFAAWEKAMEEQEQYEQAAGEE